MPTTGWGGGGGGVLDVVQPLEKGDDGTLSIACSGKRDDGFDEAVREQSPPHPPPPPPPPISSKDALFP